MNALVKVNNKLSTTFGCAVEDVSVNPHRAGGMHLIVKLSNGYGLSVLSGNNFYSKGNTYEVGTLENGNLSNVLDMQDEWHDGIYGYQNHSEVVELMRRLSWLPKTYRKLNAGE